MSLLSAAAGASAAQQSRSASAVVARPVRGFHVLRVDGYSITTTLPAGERVTSEPFYVGGRCWLIDYYPNGADGSTDSDSDAIAVYLRLQASSPSPKVERVRAEYKFSLLDLDGTAVYELPAETGIFTSAGYSYGGYGGGAAPGNPGCGYAAFITKEDLGRRTESLLKEDSLAIRCDVGVAEVEAMAVGMKRMRRSGYDSCGSESPDEYDGSHDGVGRGRRGRSAAGRGRGGRWGGRCWRRG